MNGLFGAASLLAMATTCTSPALAQTASSNNTAPSSSAEEGSSDDGIKDIVVTASRRSENIQRVALSIQALSGDALSRANVTKPEDLSTLATGVQVAASGNTPQVYIRGVGTFAAQAFSDSPIAFNLDGVYVSRTWATRGALYDLERVEVLKGPQGTLYGRNASGGAINIITAKPRLGEQGGFAEIETGNFESIRATGAVNLPLGGTAAVRVSGQVASRNGYLSDNTDDDKSQSARVQFFWEPTSDVSLLLSGHYQHVGGIGPGTVTNPRAGGRKFQGASDPAVCAIIKSEPGYGFLLPCIGNDGFNDLTVKAVTAELNWDFGPATLTVLPSYRDSTQHTLYYTAGFPNENAEHNKQGSLEVRLGGNLESLKWVVGGYLFDEKTTPLDGLPSLVTIAGITNQAQVELDLQTRSYATFGQATYSIDDRFRVTGGLRYTYERKSVDELSYQYSPPAISGPPCALRPGVVFDPTSPFPPSFCRESQPNADRVAYNNVTWKVGIEYDLAPQSMFYANVSTGFKSGGFFTGPQPPNRYDPERLTAFDAGIKNRFLGGRLQVNLEAFYWKYRDHQESYVGVISVGGAPQPAFVTVNAGRATSYGADLDLFFKATSTDDLQLKVQYNKSRYDSFMLFNSTAFPIVTGCALSGAPNGGIQNVDCSGQQLLRSPTWSGNASYDHTFDLGDRGSLRAGVSAQFASRQNLSIEFLDRTQQEAYAIVNADLTYTTADGGLSIAAFVRNIGNVEVKTLANRHAFITPANPLAGPDGLINSGVRPPRTYGARLRVQF